MHSRHLLTNINTDICIHDFLLHPQASVTLVIVFSVQLNVLFAFIIHNNHRRTASHFSKHKLHLKTSHLLDVDTLKHYCVLVGFRANLGSKFSRYMLHFHFKSKFVHSLPPKLVVE
jgi:hypothetical protein